MSQYHRIVSDTPADKAMSIREIEVFLQRVFNAAGTTDIKPTAITRINGGIKSITVEWWEDEV